VAEDPGSNPGAPISVPNELDLDARQTPEPRRSPNPFGGERSSGPAGSSRIFIVDGRRSPAALTALSWVVILLRALVFGWRRSNDLREAPGPLRDPIRDLRDLRRGELVGVASPPVGRLKRFGLVALMAFLALNVWTGSPLLALWIGSRIQGEESQPSMGAVAAVVGLLALFSFLLYQALKVVSHSYQEATGTVPTVRSHAPWLRSMRGERPNYPGTTAQMTGAERVVVFTVIVAAVAFEVWFFFFSGSSIGGGSGR
jgi:hypothetical protein